MHSASDSLRLNTIAPAPGAKRARKRVGRGDKTACRGHKGQKARAGYSSKSRFEGGQMPLHRRVPKLGFTSRKAPYVAQLRLDALTRFAQSPVTLAELKQADLIGTHIKRVRIILKGKIEVALHIADKAIHVTKGARAAIEALSGSVESDSVESGSVENA